MTRRRAVLITGRPSVEASVDETDIEHEVALVEGALAALDWDYERLEVGLDLASAAETLRALAPTVVFNLCDGIEGCGALLHLVPSLCEFLRIPYTGVGFEALFVTTNKLLTKSWLRALGLPTPAWWVPGQPMTAAIAAHGGAWLRKPAWEHGSVGIDDRAWFADLPALVATDPEWRKHANRSWYAEAFIDGREFNVSITAGRPGSDGRPAAPVILPPAEIRFVDYPPGKPRIVGYAAKWETGSVEDRQTQRSFDHAPGDQHLLARLSDLTRACWHGLGLRGYARVDFRVDANGEPWILEVNNNPCLSPDAGFIAAVRHAGLQPAEIIAGLLADALAASEQAVFSGPVGCPARHSQIEARSAMSAPQSAVAVCPAPNAPFRAEVRPDDRVAVDRIVRSTGFFHDHEISIAVELVEERLAKGEASGYHFLFADEAGQAVGYACYGEIPCTTGSYDLYWIAVADEQRGRGLGKRLLAACEADIVARQGRMIYIETSTRPQYQPTRKFYLACGYQQVAVFDDFYAPGDGKVVFGRRVAAGG